MIPGNISENKIITKLDITTPTRAPVKGKKVPRPIVSTNEIISVNIPTMTHDNIPVNPLLLAKLNMTSIFILPLRACAAIPKMPVLRKIHTNPAIIKNTDADPRLTNIGIKDVILINVFCCEVISISADIPTEPNIIPTPMRAIIPGITRVINSASMKLIAFSL
jgi:hypothetical protein